MRRTGHHPNFSTCSRAAGSAGGVSVRRTAAVHSGGPQT